MVAIIHSLFSRIFGGSVTILKNQGGEFGPKRQPGSKTKVARQDCKNLGIDALPADVSMRFCRPMRKGCQRLRFCCKEHLHKCQGICRQRRSPCEGMTSAQVATLVDVLQTMVAQKLLMFPGS